MCQKVEKKSALTHSIEKPILVNLVNLSLIFCPRLQLLHELALIKDKKNIESSKF